MPSLISGILFFFQEILDSWSLWTYAIRGDGSTQEGDFRCSEMALMHRELQAGMSSALESGPKVLDKLFRIIGGNANIIDVLRALIGFNNFVELFLHEAGKG